ncbi:divergent PAP2 family protein [cyanobiont of Ornithocercus magnificus]|nr:divergent PAP2 family protein [cyanobiont of Ornithocercus magnificus]
MTSGAFSHPVMHQLLDNGPLAWGLIACGSAQLSKLFLELLLHHRWRPGALIKTGGMPSSHSALVTGTAAAVGWQQGFDDALFVVAVAVAFVVMHDASGIRRAAGLTAARVNALPRSLWSSEPKTPLEESLGHSHLQVFIGGLMGPAVALPGLEWLGSPLEVASQITRTTG